VVAFDEAVTGVDEASLLLTDGAGNAVPASVAYDEAKKRATIVPDTRLASRTQYRVRVVGTVRDLAGNPVTATSFGFRTSDSIDPVVVSVKPKPGATGVWRGVTIRIVFSEPVTGVSKVTLRLKDRRTGKRVLATVRYDKATHSATIDPVYKLRDGRWYRIKILDGIEDLGGRDLDRRWFSFKTRP
jgi:hypothetical protein